MNKLKVGLKKKALKNHHFQTEALLDFVVEQTCECERKDVGKEVGEQATTIKKSLFPGAYWHLVPDTRVPVLASVLAWKSYILSPLSFSGLLGMKWAWLHRALGTLSGLPAGILERLWWVPGFLREIRQSQPTPPPTPPQLISSLNPPTAPPSPRMSWAFPLERHNKGGLASAGRGAAPTSPATRAEEQTRVRGGHPLSSSTLSAHAFGRMLFFNFLKRGSNQINRVNRTYSVNEWGLVSWSCSLPVGILA